MTSFTSPCPATTAVSQESSTLSVSIVQPAALTVDLQPLTSTITASLETSTSSVCLQPSVSTASQEPSSSTLTSTSVAQVSVVSCCDGSGVIDLNNFLSDDPAVFNRICNTIPPAQALAALEATLTDRQLQGYNFVYTEGGQLDNTTYQCWRKLHDLCLLSEAVADLSGLTEILTTAATDCEVLESTSEVTNHDEHGKIPADVLDISHHSFTEAVTTVSRKPTCSTPIPATFPFQNSSFPGDADNDVLPYPTPGARRGKQPKRSDKQHFFLLTSKEAIEYKQKEKEEKLAREQKKQEKVNKRVTNKKKENKQPGNSKINSKRSQRETNTEVNSTMTEITNRKGTSKKKKENKQKKTRLSDFKECESCCCFVCGEEYVDPPTEEWIQCNSCALWVHEQCANIEGTIFVCENCN